MTRVITYSFAPAGIDCHPVFEDRDYSVSEDWSDDWSTAQQNAVRDGIHQWEKYADVIMVEVTDTGAPDDSGADSEYFLRMFTGVGDGIVSGQNNRGVAYTHNQNPGKACSVWLDSENQDDLYPDGNLNDIESLSMHEAGHCVMGLPHKNGSTVMNASLNGSLTVDSQQIYACAYWHDDAQSLLGVCGDTPGRVTNLYRGILNRLPDGRGLKYYQQQIDGSLSLTALAGQMLAGSEYQGNYGDHTHSQYLDALYYGMLRRPPDSSGKSYYLGELNAGNKTRQQIAAEFASGSEAAQALADDFSDGFWRNLPS